MSGIDHELRQRAAEAIVDALGKLDAVDRAEQIKLSRTRPNAA